MNSNKIVRIFPGNIASVLNENVEYFDKKEILADVLYKEK